MPDDKASITTAAAASSAVFDRDQVSRLASAVVLGPYMVYTSRGVRNPWFRGGLALIGLGTIGYNAYQYLKAFDDSGAFGLGAVRGLAGTKSWSTLSPVEVLRNEYLLEQAAQHFEQYAPPEIIEAYTEPALAGEHGEVMRKLAEHGVVANPGLLDRWGAPAARLTRTEPAEGESENDGPDKTAENAQVPIKDFPPPETEWPVRVSEFTANAQQREGSALELAQWCNEQLESFVQNGIPQDELDRAAAACQTEVDLRAQRERAPAATADTVEPTDSGSEAASADVSELAAQYQAELRDMLTRGVGESTIAEREAEMQRDLEQKSNVQHAGLASAGGWAVPAMIGAGVLALILTNRNEKGKGK